MDADRIYADPSTISGSIGIFGLVPNITRTLDKVGVHTDGVGTTRFAGALDITRALDPQVGQIFQNVIDKGYADFTTKVAQARHRSVKEIDSIARGRVWSGAQAKERGLVDELGECARRLLMLQSVPSLARATTVCVMLIRQSAHLCSSSST